MPCSFLWGHHNIHLTFSWLLTVRECLTVEFLCAVSYLSWALCSLSVPDRTEIKEMGFLYRISFIPFPYDERDYLLPSFDMDCLLALWPLLLLISLVTCKVWSFDLYLKKLHCNMVYISTQNSIKHPVPPETWVPVSFSLSLSLSLADSLERRGLPSSFSCPGFQDLSRLLEGVPWTYMSSTSPVWGLYWFSG